MPYVSAPDDLALHGARVLNEMTAWTVLSPWPLWKICPPLWARLQAASGGCPTDPRLL
jgi:hypothetical protein